MSLALLLEAQLDAVVAAGGEAIGISAPGPFVAAIERRGVRHVPLAASTRGWSPWSDLRAAAELWRILRRERPTVLHTHNPKPGLYGRVVGRLAGVPIVVNTVHGLYATPDDPLAPPGARVRARGVRLALVRRRVGPERRGRRAHAAAPPRRRDASCATSATASTSGGSAPMPLSAGGACRAPRVVGHRRRDGGRRDGRSTRRREGLHRAVRGGLGSRARASASSSSAGRTPTDPTPSTRTVLERADGRRCRAARSSRRRRPAARRLRPVRAGHPPRGPATGGDGGGRIRAADRGHRRARLPSGRRRRDDRTARARGRHRGAAHGDPHARRVARTAGGRWARRRGRRPSASSTSATSCAG